MHLQWHVSCGQDGQSGVSKRRVRQAARRARLGLHVLAVEKHSSSGGEKSPQLSSIGRSILADVQLHMASCSSTTALSVPGSE